MYSVFASTCPLQTDTSLFQLFLATMSKQVSIVLRKFDLIVISKFAELNKVQRPCLWPGDYPFMRMSRLVAAERLPNEIVELCGI